MPLDAEAWKLANQHINGGPKGNALQDKHEAIRIIRERNGVSLRGASRSADPLMQALAAMQTNTQARHVLGIAAQYLSRGYEVIQAFPNMPAWAAVGGPLVAGPVALANRQVKQQATELLTRSRLYAEKIYKTIPDNTAPVPPQLRKQVNEAAKQAYTNLKLVSSVQVDLQQGLLSDVVDYLQTGTNKFLADQGIKVKVPKELIWAAIAIAGLAGAYFLWKIISGVMLRGAQLGEAEKAAEAIAEGEARKKRQKRLYSKA